MRLREREELARELHDTVAHHVSGIVIQAQAGQAVAATDPDRAVAVLRVIEEAASRSLAEMRAIVGILRGRRRGRAGTGPRRGRRRAAGRDPAARLPIDVELTGDLEALEPAVGAAVYPARSGVGHQRSTAMLEGRAASTSGWSATGTQ